MAASCKQYFTSAGHDLGGRFLVIIMGKLTKTIAILLCSAMLFFSMPCAAASKYLESQPLRVGFFEFAGYHMLDENGCRSGYGFDYLMHLACYGNLSYEFVGYDKSLSEMIDMLENGEIDLLTSITKTDERLEKFDFSQYPIGNSATIVTVKSGNSDYAADDYGSWSGICVGMLEDSSRNAGFDTFAQENGFSYSPVYFESTADLIEALNSGDSIDAIVTSNLRALQDEWVIAEFDSSPFYIMVKKGNIQLLEKINSAIEQLNVNEPGLQNELWNTYYSVDSGDEIAFTDEEQRFIHDMQGTTFKAIISPDRRPLSYLENGELTGIVADLVKEIIARTGLNIEIADTSTRQEYTAAVVTHDYDIRLDSWYDFTTAEKNGCLLTSPYATESISRIRLCSNDGPYKTVAAVKGVDLSEIVSRYISDDYDVVYYDTVDEAVNAVKAGMQDIAYLYDRIADYYEYEDDRGRLVSESVYGVRISFAVAVSQHCNSLLLSILNKAVLSIDNDDVTDIIEQYTTYPEKGFSVIRFIYSDPIIVIHGILMLFLLLFLATMLYLTHRRINENKKRYAEEERKNAILKDALASAERADTAKSMFLSSVSHEMRTPLNAILGFLTLSRQESPGSELITDYLKKTEISARQLQSIIDDILDTSAIESGKMKIANEPFDFNKLIYALNTIYVSQCQQKGLRYETKILSEIDRILIGDSLRLNQILLNLLSNALKFTSSGTISLTIEKLREDQATVYLRFIVADTGCGISEEMLQRLFKPFEQESAQTAILHGGSGLGLSIVKNLVGLLGGTISVESKKGNGSSFTVDLPFTRCISSEASCSQTASAFDKNDGTLVYPGLSLEGKRALVVEDNEMNRLVAVGLLEKAGIICEAAENGAAAVEMFLNSQPGYYDIILMDIQMPVMDGYEATRLIRQSANPNARDIPIVAMTASAFPEDVTKALSCGMNDFFAKPIDVPVMYKTIDRIIKQNKILPFALTNP
ncbi:MAG: transporter substrate-binding domain-containing protein [Clostridia bacterium]|nr:transporter substrate-binding domain-containing protein [Clostridia bacterium]